MNDTLKRIIAKHAESPADLLDQRTPASQLACQHGIPLTQGCLLCTEMVMRVNAGQPLDSKPAGICPQCGAHGIADRCPFSTDDVIIANLAAMIVEEFSIRDAKVLVRLLCTEGPRIGLELHEALNAPDAE